MANFEVWAPKARRVRVRVSGEGIGQERSQPLTARGGGWWQTEVAEAGPGTDYAFLLDDDETALPDPRSRWQPHGVHAASRLYDEIAYAWGDITWTGRPLAGAVVYELHIGTFTAAGTFDGAIERLDHLVDLGVDLVEVMPVNAWDGDRGWGYDGVGWFAVHEPYGGPDGFKRFVDACHQRGLGVILDVVYNHLGPSGAYLDRFGPYFTDSHVTPWGPAINLDGPESDQVRAYVLESVTTWLTAYHLDGLRLDAVHALVDERATHILEELASTVDALAAHLGRPLSLIAESDQNDPRLVSAREAGGYGLTAQWCDDIHHALHALLTGETQGYYCDFGSVQALRKTLTGAFFHDGTWSTFRGRSHGRPVDRIRIPGHRFLAYLQDHDQVGNRAAGDRISAALSPGLLKIGAALCLTGPFTPMLFMGEEWAAGTPWQYFTSHPDPELARAVREGRRAEFAEHGWAGDVPDPQAVETCQRSTLDWAEVGKEAHAQMLEFYRRLIALRREHPELTDPRLDRVLVDVFDDGDEHRWVVLHRGRIRVVCNLSPVRLAVPVDGAPIGALLASETGFVYKGGEVQLDGESVVIIELA